MRWTSRFLTSLVLGLLSATASHAQFEPIGTIEATVDGKAMTWHVPGKEAGDSGSGAMWMSMQPGTGTAVIGGFESRNTKFGRDPATGKATVSGEGSQIVITFGFPIGASSARLGLPVKGTEDVSVWVLPTIGDHAGMHAMNKGEVSVNLIDARKQGASRFEGTFSGRLIDRAGTVQRTIADGRFKIHGATHFDPGQTTNRRN